MSLTAADVLSYSPDLMRTSLLALDDVLVPAAVEMFTQLLGFCGERAFSDPLALAETVRQRRHTRAHAQEVRA